MSTNPPPTNRHIAAFAHDLKRLEQEAAATGVKLRLGLVGRLGIDGIDSIDRIALLLIQRTTGAPGTGAVVMTNLCRFADEHGALITVYAYGADLMDYYRRYYYRRFDFEIDPQGGDEARMVRNPRRHGV